MKDLAKKLIFEPNAYGHAIQPDHEFESSGGWNSQQYADAVVRNVETLLKDGMYLWSTKKDKEVIVN